MIQPPKNYTNADCQWQFEVEDGFKVEFKIESLKLPDGCETTFEHGTKNCTCSFLEVRSIFYCLIVMGFLKCSLKFIEIIHDRNTISYQSKLKEISTVVH